jgi:LysM repeat protein
MRLYITYFLLTLSLVGFSNKNKKITPEEYLQMYQDDAIKEMNRSGVPASITMAQGMLESSYGNSELARKANNHFGIKCHSDWTGKKIYKDDDSKNECFRVYKSVLDSYKDHSDFLTGKSRYAFLFDLKITDYKGWAKGLRKAGYATNPKYPELLIGLIERYNLDELDKKRKIKKTDKKDNDAPKRKDLDENPDEIVIGEESEIKQTENYVKYILAKENDSFKTISHRLNISYKRLLRYNECEDHPLKTGERVFVKPKRNWANTKYHTVKEGETLYSIAQFYGIKIKSIVKRNRIGKDLIIKPNQELKLKGFKIKKK